MTKTGQIGRNVNLKYLLDEVVALKFVKARRFASDSMHRFGLGAEFAIL